MICILNMNNYVCLMSHPLEYVEQLNDVASVMYGDRYRCLCFFFFSYFLLLLFCLSEICGVWCLLKQSPTSRRKIYWQKYVSEFLISDKMYYVFDVAPLHMWSKKMTSSYKYSEGDTRVVNNYVYHAVQALRCVMYGTWMWEYRYGVTGGMGE